MGRDDEPQFAWLALWARLQQCDEPPTSGVPSWLQSFSRLTAAAGQFCRPDRHGANEVPHPFLFTP